MLPVEAEKTHRALLQSLRDPERRSWILLCPASFGDSALVCGLVSEFKKKHGGLVTLVLPTEHAELIPMYPAIDRVDLQPRSIIQAMCHIVPQPSEFEIDQLIVAHPYWCGDGRLEAFTELLGEKRGAGAALDDLYRYILRLDWGSQFEKPVVKALSAEYVAGIDPGNSVILFPDNNSIPHFPVVFWEKLVSALKAEGKQVFTNCYGNMLGSRDEPIAGSELIRVTVTNAVPLCAYAGRVISGNNGMFCFLNTAQAQCQKTMLIHDRPFRLNGNFIKHPAEYQSFRFNNYCSEKPLEYLVNPDSYSQTLIEAIAREVMYQ